uniref:Tim44-like domain-containing protein n=1 Tax=Panagrolaimus sp. JU765 TaxID=591449 RepID=A0AC34PZ97_9BILA
MRTIRAASKLSKLAALSGQHGFQRAAVFSQVNVQSPSIRYYSAESPKSKNFLSNFVETLKEEMQKNKELQEHRKILDQRLRELNESDALKEARQKFDKVEKETAQSTEVIMHRVQEFRDHIDKMVTEIQKTEAGKKLSIAGQEALKQAKVAAELIEKTAQEIGNTQVYQQVSSAAKQIDSIAGVTMYSRPQELKMRSSGYSTSAFSDRVIEPNTEASDIELHKESKWYQGWKAFSEDNSYYNKLLDWKIRYDESDHLAVRMIQLKMRSSGYSTSAFSDRVVEPNTEASDIELHKESKWYQGWKKFSEDNSYYNKLLDWKIRYDESDHLAVRMIRGITEKVTSAFSGSNELSEVLTEIAKVDPSFDKVEWLKFCEKEVIPNILEAFIRGDLKVLEDWCHERAFVMLSTVVKEYQKSHFSTADCKIIDISKVEMVTGKMMEQGPVLVITFQVYMVNVVKNADGKVIQGNSNKPVKVQHVWVMCRDMEEYNPATAWKLLELHMQEAALAI